MKYFCFVFFPLTIFMFIFFSTIIFSITVILFKSQGLAAGGALGFPQFLETVATEGMIADGGRKCLLHTGGAFIHLPFNILSYNQFLPEQGCVGWLFPFFHQSSM